MLKEQWIKVDEHLPELGKTSIASMISFSDYVLIFNGHTKRLGFIKQYFNDNQLYWFDDCYPTEVTHWMYLPEDPTE